ncbi:hypothetical protein BWI75_24100 [Gloeocapsopsis sp. AAB1 = 1H9]|uniref:Uncharacterized protein n=1 Tax=Gloeocapsopsis dulcis AAB1 = 1H9 TaxID=1433147 RepID=A0A6N8G5N8_9CHRO|nr:hypothetical protein [Gloeocapsopsis dulcis AAB1 = 1H9]
MTHLLIQPIASVVYRSHDLDKVFNRKLLNRQSDRATLFPNQRQHNTEPITNIYSGDSVKSIFFTPTFATTGQLV